MANEPIKCEQCRGIFPRVMYESDGAMYCSIGCVNKGSLEPDERFTWVRK